MTMRSSDGRATPRGRAGRNRFRRPFSGTEPSLDILLSEPLTRLLMQADGVDRQNLMGVLNSVAGRLQRQEISRSRADFDPHRLDERKYRPGVGIVLLNAQNQIFIGRRRDVKGRAWQLPQGGIDKGETPRMAALRELKEEVGTDRVEVIAESTGWLYYDLPKSTARRAWGGRWLGQRQKWFVMRLIGPDSQIDIATAHPEFDRWQWVDMQRLPAIAVPFKRQLYLHLLGEFGHVVGA